ncbi:MAG: glutathione S-transferase N-terminal domain-containing protein [Pseudomonadales bacterium]|nr:glutathione S-transferase N-terminal domain-containing protein [Pseudomonadales bacterium]
MLDLYSWTTPNGRKVSVLLEELGLPYRVHPVDLGAGAQREAHFLALSPNGRIPALVDHDADGGPVTLFESGAILLWLAEREGRFLPSSGPARAATLEWLFWQMAGVGPMIGQLGHFVNQAPERIEYAVNRYLDESVRLLTVLDDRLRDREYVAGNVSIADFALYPWIEIAWQPLKALEPDRIGVLDAVDGWLARLARRPGVQAGMQIGGEAVERPGSS